MSIKYDVGGEVVNSSCYGDINSYLDDIDISEFRGITLHMSDAEREYGYEGIILDKMEDDYVKDMMRIARDVGFGAYIPRTLDQLKKSNEVFFPPEVPFYIVVAVTGFFRAWAGNHEHLHEAYDMLISMGLDPYTAFCGAQTLSPVNDSEWGYYAAGEHSVVPWSIFNKEGVAKFKTWADRLDTLRSMDAELEDIDGLRYDGRDEWFGACMSGNNGDWDEATPDQCETVNHIVGREGRGMPIDPYYGEFVINIDSLVEEVKTWTS